MAIFESSTHPQLYVYKVARFADGRCEVTEPNAVEVLRGLAERGAYGITESAPTVLERPAKSASKSDWVAYAVAQGQTLEEAEVATRDELAARYADGGDF